MKLWVWGPETGHIWRILELKNSRTQEEGLQNDIELTKNMENNLNIEELQTVEKNNADLKKKGREITWRFMHNSELFSQMAWLEMK